MVRVARKFGVLIAGVAAIIAGVLVYQFRPTVASLGWTAYAPLSHTVYIPPVSPSFAVAGALMAVGLVLVAGWVGFVAGRRRP